MAPPVTAQGSLARVCVWWDAALLQPAARVGHYNTQHYREPSQPFSSLSLPQPLLANLAHSVPPERTRAQVGRTTSQMSIRSGRVLVCASASSTRGFLFQLLARKGLEAVPLKKNGLD
jgi:hypothetical protein